MYRSYGGPHATPPRPIRLRKWLAVALRASIELVSAIDELGLLPRPPSFAAICVVLARLSCFAASCAHKLEPMAATAVENVPSCIFEWRRGLARGTGTTFVGHAGRCADKSGAHMLPGSCPCSTRLEIFAADVAIVWPAVGGASAWS